MRRWMLAFVLWGVLFADVTAQPRMSRTRQRGLLHQQWDRERSGDSTLHCYVAPVYVFRRKADMRRYWRLVAAVKRVYPMAQLAQKKLRALEKQLDGLDKQAQRACVKRCYKEILAEYTPVAQRMSRTQGRVLLKLINRETDYTAYEIIKEFRGGFVAGFWQSVGRLFGHNLKSEYDREHEDRMIEQIILYYEAGLL